MSKEKKLNKENNQALTTIVKETRLLKEFYSEDRQCFKQEIQENYSKISRVVKF